MVTDETSSVYVDGVAIHWYDDFLMGPENLDETHDFVPDKFMLITEACEGKIISFSLPLSHTHTYIHTSLKSGVEGLSTSPPKVLDSLENPPRNYPHQEFGKKGSSSKILKIRVLCVVYVRLEC